MKKVFIDGSQGTTGLKIFDRLKKRDDIELLTLPDELRKDIKSVSYTHLDVYKRQVY